MMWDVKEGKTGAKGQNRMTAEQVKGSRKKGDMEDEREGEEEEA